MAGIPRGLQVMPRRFSVVSVTSWWLPSGGCYFTWYLLKGCCPFLVASGWLLFICGGFQMVAVRSWCLLHVCCYFLEASRWL